MKRIKESKGLTYFLLHLLFLVFSMSGIFSKAAASCSFMSWGFLLNYGMVIFIMGVYAFFWQQLIKILPLSVAYANKAVTVIWGLIWGAILYQEKITIGKVISAAIVILGVVLYVTSNKGGETND